ncbi:hypothetical protein L0Y69_02825 [bacterium]|nr:hypothetical protein [bacterium]
MPRVLRSSEGKKKRKKRLLAGVIISFIVLGALIAGLSRASSLPALSITEIRVEGHETLPVEEIKEKSRMFLSGKYYYLFSRANAFLYPKKMLGRKLAEEYPRAESISLSLDDLHTLVIEVKERKGEYLWCGTNTPSQTPSMQCLLLDSSGFAFDTAPVLKGDARLALYGGKRAKGEASTTPITFAAGETFLDRTEFRSLLRFADEAKKLGLSPLKIFVGEENYGELHMKEGWKLIFRRDYGDADFSRFGSNLEAIARAPEWQEAVKGEKTKEGKLLYLDFRFGNKVYYKFDK